MTGHTSGDLEGSAILWADASLERIEADFSDLVIIISEDTGTRRQVRCSGYIGYRLSGFWDEVIIDYALVHRSHPFISECESKLSGSPESGCPARASSNNRLLEIALIDGCRLWVCAGRFRMEAG